MPTESKTPERERTDESLRTERLKADEDLSEKQAGVDEVADAIIEKARARADQVLAAARAKARLEARQPPPQSGEALERERDRDDEAIRAERASADAALRAERAERGFPSAEREETDRDLSHERTRSDRSVTARDVFLGMVSHDLRNMLNGMIGFASLIARRTPRDNDDEQIAAYARRIQHTGARMNRLVGDLVDVASIEAGVLSVTREEADPALVVTEAVDSFQARAAERGITLTVQFDSDLPTTAFDAARVLQVIVNLLSNAVKFTPPNGKVVVSVTARSEGLTFAVADTGPGIPEDKLEAVFELFLQITENDRRGVGLGLYIARCIVEGHGGRIWAESTLGKGSTFRFVLPLVASES